MISAPQRPRLERSGLRSTSAELGLSVLLGAAIGLSSLANGLYDVASWAPVGLAASALLIATLVARSAAISGRVMAVAAGLAALGILSLVSATWSEDRSSALIDGTRWLVYAAALTALGALTPSRAARRSLCGAVIAGSAGVAIVLEARLLFGSGQGMFVSGRLLEPVGYFNGQAALLVMGFWLAAAVAERVRMPAMSALAAAVASLQLGLAVLTQTRASIPAVVLSVVVLMAVAPGRTRRGWLLLVCALTPLIAAPAALDVYDNYSRTFTTMGSTAAARWILLGTVLSGLIWYAVGVAGERLQEPRRGRATQLARRVLVGGTVIAALGALVAIGNPITRIDHAWDSFSSLKPVPTQSRFASVGGNRYDYWRVALDEFKDEPFHGVGAGNYSQTYPQRRGPSEYIQQPHSLELQVLSELGLIGMIPLALLVVALGWCVWSGVRRPEGELSAAGLGGAAVIIVWLTQTSLDWLHLLPGVTGVALVAVVLTVPGPARRLRLVASPDGPNSAWRPRLRTALPVVLALLAVLTALESTRLMLAERYRSDARDALAGGNAPQAIEDVAQSLRFDPNAADSYYVRSAALARENKYDEARAALGVLTVREPHNYVPWVLLGDLASLRGDGPTALEDYSRALALNPRDATLAENVARARKLPGAVPAP